MNLPSYRKDEVTLEAFAGGHRIETTIAFTEPVSVTEMANIKEAFEAGLREGLLLAERVVRDRATLYENSPNADSEEIA